ncbi:hypothetical protein NE237_014123 [Protea cynaroides]|uniref:Uncharacterized protein n=1 Tax=Protea cynaroides TaxID=273540 RepID=A0A9Q0H3C6_9MAGN|nr:hypothetical protein NE237_014123 [Protea cynaroides]
MEIESKNQSSTSGKNLTNKAVQKMGYLIKLLPTGTVFFFRFLNPLFTHNGQCHTVNKVFTGILIVNCAFSCFITTFIDSYVGSDGLVHYGIATIAGLWPSPASELVDLKKFKIRIGDFVVAFCSQIVFAVVSLLDADTIQCYYPSLETNQNLFVMLLPPVVGILASAVFFYFGRKRNGIGYPASPTTSQDFL